MSGSIARDAIVQHIEDEILAVPVPPAGARDPVLVTFRVVDLDRRRRRPRETYAFPDEANFFCAVAQSLADRGVRILASDDDDFRLEGAALELFLWLVGEEAAAPKRTLGSIARVDADAPAETAGRCVTVIVLTPSAEQQPARLLRMARREVV